MDYGVCLWQGALLFPNILRQLLSSMEFQAEHCLAAPWFLHKASIAREAAILLWNFTTVFSQETDFLCSICTLWRQCDHSNKKEIILGIQFHRGLTDCILDALFHSSYLQIIGKVPRFGSRKREENGFWRWWHYLGCLTASWSVCQCWYD